MTRRSMVLLGSSALVLAICGTARAADCTPQAEMVDATCYSTIQQAADAAIALDRPLLLPRGSYQGPLTIDYTAHANTGFELISHGATVYGGLTIECTGDCFYFHQEGTLFVTGESNGPLLQLGQANFADSQNSAKIDHLVVNNSGSGIACQFNYVLSSDINAVCDSAGAIGLDVRQAQFSTFKGAASANRGYAMAIRDGYVMANVFQTIDQEASPVCTLFVSPNANGNTWIGWYQNCPQTDIVSREALKGNAVIGGVLGGATQSVIKSLD